jgi:hypothetical protein
MLSRRGKRLTLEGPLKVIETNGLWGVYAGERIVVGESQSFRDDLGVRIRERFQPGAARELAEGRSPSEAFELRRVRITVEVIQD